MRAFRVDNLSEIVSYGMWSSLTLTWPNGFISIGKAYVLVFCFIVFHAYKPPPPFFSLKVYGNPALSKLINTIFPTDFAHFGSPCQMLVILAIFSTFSL